MPRITKGMFNGHKNWNQWNVSLWISNDEPLYREAVRLYRKFPTVDCAARHFKAQLPERTPDGGRYSIAAIRAALVGLEIER
jgi:hypothetical protein